MAKRKSSSRTFKKDYEKQLNYIDHNRKRFTVDQEKQIRTGGKIKPSDVIRILSTKTDGTLDDILWDYNADYSVPSFTAQRDRLDISAITNLITWTYKNGSQNKTWSSLFLPVTVRMLQQRHLKCLKNIFIVQKLVINMY